jgi:hypothetical protein
MPISTCCSADIPMDAKSAFFRAASRSPLILFSAHGLWLLDVSRHEWIRFRRSRLFHRSRALQLSARDYAALSAIDHTRNREHDSSISNRPYTI